MTVKVLTPTKETGKQLQLTGKKVALRPAEKNKKLTVYDRVPKNEQYKILSIQSNIDERLINIKINVYEIGKSLYKAKQILPHGSFQTWIEETWGKGLPYPTAAHYKGIYEHFKGQAQTVKALPITFLMQMRSKNFPEKLKETIVQNPKAFKSCSTRKFTSLCQQVKQGKIDVKEFTGLAKKQVDIAVKLESGETSAAHSLRSQRVLGVGLKNLRPALLELTKICKELRQYFPPGIDPIDRDDPLGEHLRMTVDSDGYLLADIDEGIELLKMLKQNFIGLGWFAPWLTEEDGIVEKRYGEIKKLLSKL
jgi:hypothetical protein